MTDNNQILKNLDNFVNTHGYPISGEFELRPQESSDLWGLFDLSEGFNGSPQKKTLEKAQQFHFFGASGDGSLFALWKKSSKENPVVYFGSGGHYKVLTPNLIDFIALLSIGYQDPGYENIEQPPKKIFRPPWFFDYAKSLSQNLPQSGAHLSLKVARLNKEFLDIFFNTALLTPSYGQFHICNASNTPSPENINDSDIACGYKTYPGGIVFFLEDRDNDYIEITASLAQDRLSFEPHKIHVPSIELKELWTHNPASLPYKFQPANFQPDIYEVGIIKKPNLKPKTCSANDIYHLLLFPAS